MLAADTRVVLLSADEGIRTHTRQNTPLKRARLPVSPHLHMLQFYIYQARFNFSVTISTQ